jgi:tetratricopeptide (TPR) repeat protein
VRLAATLIVAALALGSARVARSLASITANDDAVSDPFVPARRLAPFFALGYREAVADMLYVRMRGYVGGYYGTRSATIGALGEAITELDPRFRGAYAFAANAMTFAEREIDQASLVRAVALLERGIAQFPEDWQMPYLAGQIYIQDLVTDDPAQRRTWDERGTLLVESSLRKPGAPQAAATWAAFLRTKLGQEQRAIEGLRELLLLSQSHAVRQRLLEDLARLSDQGSDELASEIFDMRRAFERESKGRGVNPSMYLSIGPRLQPGFNLTDLATGGSDIFGSSAPGG